MHRQTITWTVKAKAMAIAFGALWFFYITVAILYLLVVPIAGLVTALLAPYFVILIAYLIVLFGWLYYEEPRRSALLKKSAVLFENHSATKIAISGSYGKTTMKELLNTVLSEAKIVAATPGNRNVPVSHAAWIKKLTGNEDVLLLEYGEGTPGDIKKLAKLTHPDVGIITGLAPNHLDAYKHLSAVARDLLSLQDFVDAKKIYINADTFKDYDISGMKSFSTSGVRGWTIDKAQVALDGTSFKLHKGKQTISVSSGLLGQHLVAPLALTAVLALDLGLTIKQVEAGLAKTVPYQHRMQPRKLHGAWIVDDTYNGSLEGLRAGLALLAELPAKRKIYVTPGLVDQGEETQTVHLEIGSLIAAANPERVVLMQNSVTGYIIEGLEKAQYKGNLQIEADPLAYYTNLEHIVAAGDLVMMQNDWTDNYQ